MAIVQGIDTGSWRVRVATLTGSFRRFVLRDVMEMESTVGIGEAISAIRSHEPGWEQAERVAALPLDRAVVRLVRLPFTDRATIAKALPAEVESSVPYDLEDMVLESQLVDADRGFSRTRVVIAKKDAMGDTLELLRAARSEPSRIVLDAEALASYADRGVQAVVDVGHERTLVVVCQGGQLLSARLVAVAGHAQTIAIAQACNLSEGDAELLKHTMQISNATAGAPGWSDAEPTHGSEVDPVAQRALLGAVDELVVELRARLLAVEDELGLGVDDVLLAGAASQLTGFAGRLSNALGIPARAVVVPGGHPAGCALVVALGRIAADEVKALDLRVGSFAHRGHADVLWSVAGYGLLATAGALVIGTGVLVWRATEAWQRLDELDTQLVEKVTGHFADIDPARLEEPSDALLAFQERALEVQLRVDALGATVSGAPPVLSLLKQLSLALPANNEARIDVRELTITEEAVSMRAETDSYESAAKIEESLQGSATFSQARKSDEKKLGEGLSFNLSIPLGEPESPELPVEPTGLPGTEG